MSQYLVDLEDAISLIRAAQKEAVFFYFGWRTDDRAIDYLRAQVAAYFSPEVA